MRSISKIKPALRFYETLEKLKNKIQTGIKPNVQIEAPTTNLESFNKVLNLLNHQHNQFGFF